MFDAILYSFKILGKNKRLLLAAYADDPKWVKYYCGLISINNNTVEIFYLCIPI